MVHITINLASEKFQFSVEEPTASAIKELLVEFLKYYNKNGNNKNQLFSDYLKLLQIKVDRLKTDSNNGSYKSHNQRILQKFLNLIERDLHKTHKVTDYSEKLGITTRKLTLVCRQIHKKSPKSIIDQRLVSESKRLLKYTTHPIKEISAQLGFADPYQFSKYFKKHVKVSPAYFRVDLK
ncbi:MAG: transcriptional regulator, AraC family [Bacteroidetes bacterium]|jgi:AraC-like DNA-binding protein|nr:transcriptional regulator, AraC family [Bacteroidota bacterium]